MDIHSVLLLEDHPQAAAWLAGAMRMAWGDAIEVAHRATLADGLAAIDSDQHFDLFVCDLQLPDGSGVTAIERFRRRRADTPVVVASIYADDAHVFPALKAGACGYLLKEDPQTVIAGMLGEMLAGRPPISGDVARRLLGYFHAPRDVSDDLGLTERERETLGYLAKGMTVREAAGLMGISWNTANGYTKEIYRKLNVSSRAEAALEAARMGIVRT